MSDYQLAWFLLRMIRVVKNARHRIGEHRQRLSEADAVLLDVFTLFRRIPLEFWSRHFKTTGGDATRSTRRRRAAIRRTAMSYPARAEQSQDNCTAFARDRQASGFTPVANAFVRHTDADQDQSGSVELIRSARRKAIVHEQLLFRGLLTNRLLRWADWRHNC
jgi:hypothetical protein